MFYRLRRIAACGESVASVAPKPARTATTTLTSPNFNWGAIVNFRATARQLSSLDDPQLSVVDDHGPVPYLLWVPGRGTNRKHTHTVLLVNENRASSILLVCLTMREGMPEFVACVCGNAGRATSQAKRVLNGLKTTPRTIFGTTTLRQNGRLICTEFFEYPWLRSLHTITNYAGPWATLGHFVLLGNIHCIWPQKGRKNRRNSHLA